MRMTRSVRGKFGTLSPKRLGKYNITFKDVKKYYTYNYKVFDGGRTEAVYLMQEIEKQRKYSTTKDFLNIPTTRLSAYIKFGCVSIREVYYLFVRIFKKSHPLVRQLIWRDFYYHLGFNFIQRFGKSFKPKFEKARWKRSDGKHLHSWKRGRTGYPLVDASMRQLNETGYMPNRGRLIVASFLVKNLNYSWRLGEKYFATKLVDYDPYVNQGNWQWVAGSGADSQPYIRIFNPWLQSKKYDRDCEYIKKWVPELQEVDNKVIHNWYKYYNRREFDYIRYSKPIVDYVKTKKIAIQMSPR